MTVRSASPSSSAGLFRKRGAVGDSEDFSVVHSLLGTWPRIASCSSRARIWFAFPSIDAGDGGAFRRAVPGFLIFVLAVASGCSSLFELPTVATGPASAPGTAAITVNGSVNPHAVATHYYFEYGTSAAYGKRTPVRELPSRLAAYFYESWDEGPGGWATWGVKQSLHRDGGHSNGFLRISEPSTLNDYNHRMAGILHLAKFFYSGPVYKSAYLGGGDPDFRDARVRLWVRGNDWKPNGSELIWWTQSQSNIEAGNQRGVFRRANWGYTGFTLTAHLRDGNWNRSSTGFATTPPSGRMGGVTWVRTGASTIHIGPLTRLWAISTAIFSISWPLSIPTILLLDRSISMSSSLPIATSLWFFPVMEGS